MQYFVQGTLGFTVVATDATCGHVHDILFDSVTWSMRYLVLCHRDATGRQLFQLPFGMVCGIDAAKRTVHYTGTRASAQSESLVDIDPPVSRQQQLKRRVIRALAPIYEFDFMWGTAPMRPNYPHLIRNEQMGAKPTLPDSEMQYDPHLRSSREVIGYRVQSPNGKAGRVVDIVYDDSTRLVQYLVVERRRFLRRTRVLLPTDSIHGICWSLMRVSTDMNKKAVQSLPRSAAIH